MVGAPTPSTPQQQRFAIVMLALSALFWGMGFAWAKNVGESANHAAGMPDGSSLGPMLMLAIRFIAAGVLWAVIFPASLRGWSRASVARGLAIGGMMCAGVVPQHLGLDLSSEAVIAFLTNLTVVLVPLFVAITTLRLPAARLIIASLVAFAGIYLLTGAKPTGLSTGELLGVLCAVAFTIELLFLNWLIPKDSAYRLTLMMFIVCGAACAIAAIASPGFSRLDVPALLTSRILIQIGLLTVFTTAISFGLMTIFQPRIDATRAAIIYLLEPVFAAGYAWLTEPDAAMSRLSLYGAALILLANIIAEIQLPRRRAKSVGE